MKQFIKEPTRVYDAAETIIDFLFSNDDIEAKVNHTPQLIRERNFFLTLLEIVKIILIG